jgi:hypothetical protein
MRKLLGIGLGLLLFASPAFAAGIVPFVAATMTYDVATPCVASTADGTAVPHVTKTFEEGSDEICYREFHWFGGSTTATATLCLVTTGNSDGTRWALSVACVGDGDETVDPTFGSAVNVTITDTGTGDERNCATSASITPGGTVEDQALCYLKVQRLPSDGADTSTSDEKFIDGRVTLE